MSPGDTVVYTLEHYEWLCLAGKWPRKLGRLNCVGFVAAVEGDRVQVKWPNPIGAQTQTHWADNLEVKIAAPA